MKQILRNFRSNFIGKIHQYISAKNDIHCLRVICQRWVNGLCEVQAGKGDHFPDLRANLKILIADLPKVPGFQPIRAITKGPLAVNTFHCFAQRLRINICSQNQNFPILKVGYGFMQCNGNGISLFAC